MCVAKFLDNFFKQGPLAYTCGLYLPPPVYLRSTITYCYCIIKREQPILLPYDSLISKHCKCCTVYTVKEQLS
jgi:hypothetical protein